MPPNRLNYRIFHKIRTKFYLIESILSTWNQTKTNFCRRISNIFCWVKTTILLLMKYCDHSFTFIVCIFIVFKSDDNWTKRIEMILTFHIFIYIQSKKRLGFWNQIQVCFVHLNSVVPHLCIAPRRNTKQKSCQYTSKNRHICIEDT